VQFGNSNSIITVAACAIQFCAALFRVRDYVFKLLFGTVLLPVDSVKLTLYHHVCILLNKCPFAAQFGTIVKLSTK